MQTREIGVSQRRMSSVQFWISNGTSNKIDAWQELTDCCLNVRILVDELHTAFEAAKEALTTAENALGNFAIGLLRFLL